MWKVFIPNCNIFPNPWLACGVSPQRCFKLKQWTSGQQKLPLISLSWNYELLIFAEHDSLFLSRTSAKMTPTNGDFAKTITKWPGPKPGTQGRCEKPCCNSREQFTHNLPRPKIHPQIFRPFPPWSLGAHGWMWIKMGWNWKLQVLHEVMHRNHQYGRFGFMCILII